MCKMKDYIEQHPDEKFPEEPKVEKEENCDAWRDEQEARDEREADRREEHFAPSEGYK